MVICICIRQHSCIVCKRVNEHAVIMATEVTDILM